MPGVNRTNALTVRHTIFNMSSHYPKYVRRPNLLEMKLRALCEDVSDNILPMLGNIQWRVYRCFDSEGVASEYVLAPDFIRVLSDINTYKDFQTLPYTLKSLRQNFNFLIRDKVTIPGEVEKYVDKTVKSFILGASVEIDMISGTQNFHADDEFGHNNDVFIWFDNDYVYKGRPYHIPQKLGPTSPDLKGLLETVHKVVANFITQRFI